MAWIFRAPCDILPISYILYVHHKIYKRIALQSSDSPLNPQTLGNEEYVGFIDYDEFSIISSSEGLEQSSIISATREVSTSIQSKDVNKETNPSLSIKIETQRSFLSKHDMSAVSESSNLTLDQNDSYTNIKQRLKKEQRWLPKQMEKAGSLQQNLISPHMVLEVRNRDLNRLTGSMV